METELTDDQLPPLTRGGGIHPSVPIGAVVDRWDCPCCDRVIAVVHRAGRPRLYCSQACRQRAYRWRRRHAAATTSTPEWPAEQAAVRGSGGRTHALRAARDPLSRRRDRRGREVTACGALAHPHASVRARGHQPPFLGGASTTACRTCAALTSPRPLGLVPPGAMPPIRPPRRGDDAWVRALRSISDDYPLDPQLRHLLATTWAA